MLLARTEALELPDCSKKLPPVEEAGAAGEEIALAPPVELGAAASTLELAAALLALEPTGELAELGVAFEDAATGAAAAEEGEEAPPTGAWPEAPTVTVKYSTVVDVTVCGAEQSPESSPEPEAAAFCDEIAD